MDYEMDIEPTGPQVTVREVSHVAINQEETKKIKIERI